MDMVSVVIPTLNRPAPLRRAIASLARQLHSDSFEFEVIVVDNSATGSARVGVTEIAAEMELPIVYVNHPIPGISSARNAGVRAATGRWIAFLDDDEEAGQNWLVSLVAVMRRGGADAVFGPVVAKCERPTSILDGGRHFSRQIQSPDGADITKFNSYLGTNNSLFDRSRCLYEISPFDETLDGTGGEDSLLLKRLVLSGRRFRWASDARVVEWVPESRMNWAYIRKRKFLSGQIRVFVLSMLRPARRLEIAFWMAIGFVQMAMGAVAMLLLMPFRGQRYSNASVTFFAGLGKLLWVRRFRPTLYGKGLLS